MWRTIKRSMETKCLWNPPLRRKATDVQWERFNLAVSQDGILPLSHPAAVSGLSSLSFLSTLLSFNEDSEGERHALCRWTYQERRHLPPSLWCSTGSLEEWDVSISPHRGNLYSAGALGHITIVSRFLWCNCLKRFVLSVHEDGWTN